MWKLVQPINNNHWNGVQDFENLKENYYNVFQSIYKLKIPYDLVLNIIIARYAARSE